MNRQAIVNAKAVNISPASTGQGPESVIMATQSRSAGAISTCRDSFAPPEGDLSSRAAAGRAERS